MYKIGRDKVNLAQMRQLNAATGQTQEVVQQQMDPGILIAEKTAEEIVQEARAKAEDILLEAETEAKNLKNEAWQIGYNDGRYEGNKKMRAQLDEGAADIARLLGEIRAARNAMFDQCEEEMVRLCLETVRKVLGSALQTDKSLMTAMITRVLSSMRLEGKITIKVSPREYKQFFSEGSETFALRDGDIVADIEEDASLTSGGLVIQSDRETVDAGVDTQLRYISLAFAKAAGEDR